MLTTSSTVENKDGDVEWWVAPSLIHSLPALLCRLNLFPSTIFEAISSGVNTCGVPKGRLEHETDLESTGTSTNIPGPVGRRTTYRVCLFPQLPSSPFLGLAARPSSEKHMAKGRSLEFKPDRREPPDDIVGIIQKPLHERAGAPAYHRAEQLRDEDVRHGVPVHSERDDGGLEMGGGGGVLLLLSVGMLPQSAGAGAW